MNWEPYILWTLLLVVFPGIVISWMWFWTEPADEWVKRRTGFYEPTALDYDSGTTFRITRPAKATRTKRVSGKPKTRGRKQA